jgi:hypothetical protein
MICKDGVKRLKNIENIESHPFFAGINWDKVINKKLAPFNPETLRQKIQFFPLPKKEEVSF